MSSTKIQKPKKNEYVSNKKLNEVMKDYINKKKENPDTLIPNYVGECLWLIATKLSHKINFSRYSYKEEMISDGIENCIKYIDNFNPEKTNNPFAYFTTIIYNAFIRRINTEKKQQYLKYKNAKDFQLQEQLVNNTYIPDNNEVIDSFIKQYEEKIEIKKLKPKGLDVIFEEKE